MTTNPPLVTAEMQAAETFLEVFYLREKGHPNQVYLRQPFGKNWKELTWGEVGDQARRMAAALKDLGLEKGDHVGLLSKNCYHWIIADLAILMGGYVSVPFFPTLSAEQLAQIIEHSDIKALFVGKLEGWEKQKDGLPKSMPCIAFPHYEGNSKIIACHNWEQLTQKYQPISAPHMPTRDELFTIIYTSGTTGTPKGVMLTYEAPYQISLYERQDPVYGVYQGKAERLFSYLPLNHIAERMVTEIISILAGSTIAFTESLFHFATNLQSVRPTFFFAVPRIWAKLQQGVLAQMPQKRLDLLLKIPILNGYVKNKIRDGLGMSDVRAAISGSAPLPAATLKWFETVGIKIQEVYGASETCGGVTYISLDEITPGAVGKPVPGAEIAIAPDMDEVLVKAPWLTIGYYKDPEKTAEVLKDGYYYTGDTGRFDARGNLIITGRCKDGFKSAKGEYILPAPIESEFSRNPYVDQVVVTGLGLPQPIALICLSEGGLAAEKLAVTQSLAETLSHVNKQLPPAQKLESITIMSKPWTEENSMITPTLKIRRHKVDEAYAHHYETWYEDREKVIWQN